MSWARLNRVLLKRNSGGAVLQGTQDVVLMGMQPISIHGQLYYGTFFHLPGDPEEQLRRARLGPEVIYSNPQPGDWVRLHFIMSIVIRVEKLEA